MLLLQTLWGLDTLIGGIPTGDIWLKPCCICRISVGRQWSVVTAYLLSGEKVSKCSQVGLYICEI